MAWSVQRDFRRIGARVQTVLVTDHHVARRPSGRFPPVRITVARDRGGPYFLIERRWTVTVNVAQVNAQERQLLLVADHFRYGPQRYSRFLCGRDERDWFVTPLPMWARVWTIEAAWDALKPAPVPASDDVRELAGVLA